MSHPGGRNRESPSDSSAPTKPRNTESLDHSVQRHALPNSLSLTGQLAGGPVYAMFHACRLLKFAVSTATKSNAAIVTAALRIPALHARPTAGSLPCTKRNCGVSQLDAKRPRNWPPSGPPHISPSRLPLHVARLDASGGAATMRCRPFTCCHLHHHAHKSALLPIRFDALSKGNGMLKVATQSTNHYREPQKSWEVHRSIH